jgi:fructokinase
VIVVVGEQVVDLVPAGQGLLRAALGGGPANTAIAAARLGAKVAMAARTGRDSFGAAFKERLAAAGVDTRYVLRTSQPSALALATVDETGEARYDFWLAGAADFNWRYADLPQLEAGTTIHLGSLAAFLAPGADVLERWALDHQDRCTISFDPNLRPVALNKPDSLVRLERLAELANVIRVSSQDLTQAYPGTDPMLTARRWLAHSNLVVVTHGSSGATVLAKGEEVTLTPPPVTIADTIGAGDTSTGAVLAWLQQHEWPVTRDDFAGLLKFVCTAAALNCTRAGADPPSLEEVTRWMNVPGRGEQPG